MADLLKFLFKSKFMRKVPHVFSIFSINFLLYSIVVSCSKECSLGVTTDICQHGECKDSICECHPGWNGKFCEFCSGRVRLINESGVITDGLGNYSKDNQCTWLVDPSHPNASIRFYLDHYATECSWDHLYVYDGASIYDPLVAVFSGSIIQDVSSTVKTREVLATSGRALLHFYSDAEFNLTGFSISYKVNGCPRSLSGVECSDHGICVEGICTCDAGWSGEDCGTKLCPDSCFGHGQCSMEDHRCLCNEGYAGKDCRQNISSGWWESIPESFGDYGELRRASHAAVVIGDEMWLIGGHSFRHRTAFVIAHNTTDGSVRSVESHSKLKPRNRYGHSAVVYNGSIYMYGGATAAGTETAELWRFEPDSRAWTIIDDGGSSEEGRQKRDSGNDIHIYPKSKEIEKGIDATAASKKLSHRFEMRSEGWCERKAQKAEGGCGPVGVAGHTAVVVKDAMLVFFGHSSSLGMLHVIQEYNFISRRWSVSSGAVGALVLGRFSATAVWDESASLVLVYGGLGAKGPSDQLVTYNPFLKKWSLRNPSPTPRFLHSASLIGGLMLVFGGNSNNDTNALTSPSAYLPSSFEPPLERRCYSADFIAYDVRCDAWYKLKGPPNLDVAMARYGHAVGVVTAKEGKAMRVVGGFNGHMLDSILVYHPGSCSMLSSSKESCLSQHPGRKCVWNRNLSRCESLDDSGGDRRSLHSTHALCLPRLEPRLNTTALCTAQKSCQACLFNTYSCVWCNKGCFYKTCNSYEKGISDGVACENRRRWSCKMSRSCASCGVFDRSCFWLNSECTFAPNRTEAQHNLVINKPDVTVSATPQKTPHNETGHELARVDCYLTCSQRTTCSNCTYGQDSCLWCFNEQRCVNNNSYQVSFPYGQCTEWTTESRRCIHTNKSSSRCRFRRSCSECHSALACGWCDDGSGTGTGRCLEGGYDGPTHPVTGKAAPRKCPSASRWFFTSCPVCNCNGHSFCVNGSSTCEQPCDNHTSGEHCERCDAGFFGNPVNGGSCKPCQCNNHGTSCESETGVCHCHTKGITGEHCERCDSHNNYYGDPLKGSCFYDLQIDYQFTFNLSKQEDAHIRQINFYNEPSRPKIDTDFDISCSKPATIHISAKQTGEPEIWPVRNFSGMTLEYQFLTSDFEFGSEEKNTTFKVFVSDFVPPIEIVISFSQYQKLDLVQFFSIFFLCFMALLITAFVMWKIKQKYDLHTRRQRLMVEMEAMASRPFRAILLELQMDAEALRLRRLQEQEEKALKASQEEENKEETKEATETIEDESVKIEEVDDQAAKEMEVKFSDTSTELSVASSEATAVAANESTTAVAKAKGAPSVCNGSVAAHLPLHVPCETKLIRKSTNPSPISLEPCEGNRAAVLSLLVQLPTGGELYTSSGHPGGLAVASTLVTLGPTRRASLEAAAANAASCDGHKANNATKGKGLPRRFFPEHN